LRGTENAGEPAGESQLERVPAERDDVPSGSDAEGQRESQQVERDEVQSIRRPAWQLQAHG